MNILKKMLNEYRQYYRNNGVIICCKNVDELKKIYRIYQKHVSTELHHELQMYVYHWCGDVYFWVYKNDFRLIAWHPNGKFESSDEYDIDKHISVEEYFLLKNLGKDL